MSEGYKQGILDLKKDLKHMSNEFDRQAKPFMYDPGAAYLKQVVDYVILAIDNRLSDIIINNS